MKTKLVPLLLLLAAACGAEGSYDKPYDPSATPENLGVPCDTVFQNKEYVILCGGVQLNVENSGHIVKCYLKVEEDKSRTIRCTAALK